MKIEKTKSLKGLTGTDRLRTLIVNNKIKEHNYKVREQSNKISEINNIRSLDRQILKHIAKKLNVKSVSEVPSKIDLMIDELKTVGDYGYQRYNGESLEQVISYMKSVIDEN